MLLMKKIGKQSATFIEQYTAGQSSSFQNTSVFCCVKENATLNHIRIFSNADLSLIHISEPTRPY